MKEFFAMGGYAWYVWGSYGLTALVIAAEVIAVTARLKRAREEARATAADGYPTATGGAR